MTQDRVKSAEKPNGFGNKIKNAPSIDSEKKLNPILDPLNNSIIKDRPRQ